MLKNPANAPVQTQWFMLGSYHCVFVSGHQDYRSVISKIERFIEQCPLKIKHLKIEGFV